MNQPPYSPPMGRPSPTHGKRRVKVNLCLPTFIAEHNFYVAKVMVLILGFDFMSANSLHMLLHRPTNTCIKGSQDEQVVLYHHVAHRGATFPTAAGEVSCAHCCTQPTPSSQAWNITLSLQTARSTINHDAYHLRNWKLTRPSFYRWRRTALYSAQAVLGHHHFTWFQSLWSGSGAHVVIFANSTLQCNQIDIPSHTCKI